ncbi:deoxyribonuclease IV [SAR202 cluster bacterium AC-647-N09_OGT_505m]|nr:deoxyribonuclease IV [SAR202 cluster bacterium AC-647-N09_OGT_505m]
MKVGAHVSTAGGLDKAIDRAQEMSAEAIQIFPSSPRSWAFKPIPPTVTTAFLEKAESAGIGPIFLHGIYLVSLGAPTEENLDKSVQALINYMEVARDIGAAGVIFHTGSHRGVGFQGVFDQAVRAMEQVLKASPENVWLTIENSAGMGNHICSKFQEIGQIIKALDSPQVKVCLDTQHLFAAGYEVTEKAGLERVMEEFDREIGLSNLVALHANDSKTPFASAVDRHENIGQGHMGLDGFRVIMSHPAFRDVPFLLEVPGEDGNGPDRSNLDILKRLRKEAELEV